MASTKRTASTRKVRQKNRQPSRTNVVLDPVLVDKVKKLSRARTTREAVHLAMEHYARSRDYSRVLALIGAGGVAPGYDPKDLEQGSGR